MSTLGEVDIGSAAIELLGEPSNRTARELRYGQHGSLSIDLRKRVWHDFETGEGGGVLALVQRELGGDQTAAWRWLESHDFIEAGDSASAAIRPAPAWAMSRDLAKPKADTEKARERRLKIETARAIWNAGKPADDTLGRAYLVGRFAWPPSGTGPALPHTVRWLPAERAPASVEAAGWFGLPAEAIGALLFVWHEPRTEALTAVSLLAVNAAGGRVMWYARQKRKICMIGVRTLFTARNAEPGVDLLHVVEGEIDALALSLAPWCGPGRVVAAGQAGRMTYAALRGGHADVVLYCDSDRAGRNAVRAAGNAIEAEDRRCKVVWHSVDSDPANELREKLLEYAAIREYADGEDRETADRETWRKFLGSAQS